MAWNRVLSRFTFNFPFLNINEILHADICSPVIPSRAVDFDWEPLYGRRM